MRIQTLTADDIATFQRALMSLLIDCVNAGASIGYHAPMRAADADAFWRGVQDGVRDGERVVLAAFADSGALLGTGQLRLELRPNGAHRAELQKLLVAPEARRQGVARALMAALEAHALAAGRTLLVLDTREGDAAADLYRSLGWHFVGRVPSYVLEQDGSFSATLIFCRELPAP